MPKILYACIFCIAAFVFGCQTQKEEPGVVAMVNNMPIYLDELESRYDLQSMSWSSLQNPSVSKLRKDYGVILGDLIVQKLVYQALDELNLSVNVEEIAEAEAKVRADYPKGMFEQVLMEECIDLEHWREQLRARLAHEKFLREVLRPNIRLDYREAEQYYFAHIDDFHLPSRVSFLLLSGPGREMVAKAIEQYKEHRDIDQLFKNFDNLEVQDLKVRQDRLPVSWRQELDSLKPGEAGAVTKGDAGFQALFLKERIISEVLPAGQAYPFVERVLLEEKLQEAFRQWLDQKLASATIYVSSHLLAGKDESDDEEELAEAPASQEEMPLDEHLEDNSTAIEGVEEFINSTAAPDLVDVVQ